MADQSADKDCDHMYLQEPQSHNDNTECHQTGSRKIPVVLKRGRVSLLDTRAGVLR